MIATVSELARRKFGLFLIKKRLSNFYHRNIILKPLTGHTVETELMNPIVLCNFCGYPPFLHLRDNHSEPARENDGEKLGGS